MGIHTNPREIHTNPRGNTPLDPGYFGEFPCNSIVLVTFPLICVAIEGQQEFRYKTPILFFYSENNLLKGEIKYFPKWGKETQQGRGCRVSFLTVKRVHTNKHINL